MKFDWDPRKASSNLVKHGVSFAEAVTVFEDPWALVTEDPLHPAPEMRFVALGMSSRERILVVVHCERDDGAAIRIISARRATAGERALYEEAHP